MPYYLFTYHAYGSWLPDRKQGYVKRKQGILATDSQEAALYRGRMVEDEKVFDDTVQQEIIAALLGSTEKQTFELFYIATESSHAHVLLGWSDDRSWMRMRSTVKGSISRYLNQNFGKQEWLAEGGSRKRVRDRPHFDYLVNEYLPNHRGWKWSPEKGVFR